MLGKEEICVEKISGLTVKRIDKRVEIELPKLYSRESIPFRRNQIPTPEVAEKWPHLMNVAKKLHPCQSGTDVGILIGCNCPRAIKPREVVLRKGDDPHAVKTLLGWGIISQSLHTKKGKKVKKIWSPLCVTELFLARSAVTPQQVSASFPKSSSRRK